MSTTHAGLEAARQLLAELPHAAPGRRAQILGADPAAIIAAFEPLAAAMPDLPGLAEVLAAAYRRDARYDDAIRVVAGDPTPSEQMLYEMAVSQACLGQVEDSLASWDALIARAPGLAAAWYGSHGPALELLGWAEAEQRLERAAACPKANGKYRAMLAAYDVLADRPSRDFNRKHLHLVESAAALLPHRAPELKLFGVSASLLRWALAQARAPGLVLEFGVRRGASLKVIAEQAGQEVHGFDSFEGLPEDWSGTTSGVLTTGRQLPAATDKIRLHPGWFEDTLPGFLASHPGPVRFVNLDSDLYSSAKTVLNALGHQIGPGTVLVFDEFIGNRSWRNDEYRAFHEYAEAFGIHFRIIAVNPACKQVALEIVAGSTQHLSS